MTDISLSDMANMTDQSYTDISKALRVAAAVKSGTVWVNCYDVFDAAAHPAGNPDILWAPGLGQTEVLPVASFARLPPTTPSAIRH